MTTEDIFVKHGKKGTPLNDVLVIDTHCHLGRTTRMSIIDSTIESMINTMDRLGVDISTPNGLTAYLSGDVCGGNDLVINAVQRYPERIIGYMAVNPCYPIEASHELNRCLKAGLKGLKIHSGVGVDYDQPCYELLWEFVAENNIPVMAHGATNHIQAIEPALEKYSSVTFSIAHAGIDGPDAYIRVAKKYPNVYIDTCVSSNQRGLIEHFIAEGLEDKLMWGSDIAFLDGPTQLGKILFAKITPEQKIKILGINACKVLKLNPDKILSTTSPGSR